MGQKRLKAGNPKEIIYEWLKQSQITVMPLFSLENDVLTRLTV
jgi:hypothetical protein